MSVNLVHVVHCTVAHNTASWGGGAFFDNSPSLNASAFALNSATSSGDQFAGNGPIPQMRFVAVPGASSDIYFPFSAVQPRVGFELLQYAPAFSSPLGADGMASTWLDNNYRLDPRSPLIDAVYTENPHRDFDWNPGPIEGIAGRGLRLDPGCYELQTTLCAADMDADGRLSVGAIVLRLSPFEQGPPPAALANGNFAQPLPSPDGGVTVDDLLFFLARFEQGC